MAETHVITALVAKRAELSGQMMDLDRRKSTLKTQINHIDQSLAIFGYKREPRDIRPIIPKKRRFKKLELPRLMRQFTHGTNRDIALAIIAFKGWDIGDTDLIANVADSVKSAKNWANRKARVALVEG